MKRIAGVLPVVFIFITGYFFYLLKVNPDSDFYPNYDTILPSPTVTPTPSPELPESHIIPIRTHVFQTFNNCGPASLSMLLSYYDINISQKELGEKLRPYQHPRGDNDDKSVTLEELAMEAENYGFNSYHRPGGNIEILKRFIAEGIPVVIRTWLKADEDIGHYRLIRGYDDLTGEIIQDDSLENSNLRFTYDNILRLWKAFNYEFLVIAPQDKIPTAKAILSENEDRLTAWQNAKLNLEEDLRHEPDDMYTLFNLSVAHYHLGDFSKSIEYFERIEQRLPWRMLWYQIEPVEAYFRLKNYDRVFELTDKILNNYNRAFSELYFIRGNIYLEQGKSGPAKTEFEKAVKYNENFTPAFLAF